MNKPLDKPPLIRVLVFSSLYPNPGMERHGIFVETRLRKVLQRGGVAAEVIAPVPWLPPFFGLLSRYRQFAEIPATEERHGVTVHHPRYLVIPKVGMLFTPFFMALSVWLCLRKLLKEGKRFDLVDAHYYYPDGVAAAIVCKHFKLPFSITARGTDINLIPEYSIPRSMILRAAREANVSITVCQALKDRMTELGASADKIRVLRNGVDLDFFHPIDRNMAREKLSLSGPVILSVGHLIERKGHHLVIEALSHLPGYTLLIAGDGEMLSELKAQSRALGVEERVFFLGALSQSELVNVYNAADILVLASSREGWANVLLESMACGTPVVATNIWGTPEVVASSDAGRLVDERTPVAIAEKVMDLMQHYPDRRLTRLYAERFSWDATAGGCYETFVSILSGAASETEV